MTQPPQAEPPKLDFAYGFGLPLRGARFLMQHRGLWPYVVLPILIGLVLMGGALWLTVAQGSSLTAWVLERPTRVDWLGRLMRVGWYMGNALVHIIFFGLLSVTSWFVASLLASPFYDQLSHLVERERLGQDWVNPGEGRGGALSDIWLGIVHSLAGMTLYLATWCVLLPLQIVPVIGNLAHIVLSGSCSAFFLAREVTDFSLSRRRLTFGEKVGLLRRNLSPSLGLGIASLLLVSIPFANFLCMPIAVIGGTLFYCDLESQGRLSHIR